MLKILKFSLFPFHFNSDQFISVCLFSVFGVTDLCPEQSHDWTWTAAVWGLLQADAITSRMRKTHARAHIHRLWLCHDVTYIFLYYCTTFDNHPFQPLTFKPKCICWRLIHTHTHYLNLSVQSHRKSWSVCTKPKIS